MSPTAVNPTWPEQYPSSKSHYTWGKDMEYLVQDLIMPEPYKPYCKVYIHDPLPNLICGISNKER